MDPITATEVRSFGDTHENDIQQNQTAPTCRLAKLTARLVSAISTHTNEELHTIAIILMENHSVPITTVRTFLHHLPVAIFAMRKCNRRTILYNAITSRGAIVPDILHLSPARVLSSGDSNGMTPFHFACRHGSINDIQNIGALTPQASLERLSRAGRSPLVEAICLQRGTSTVDAVMNFVSHANLWQTKDRFGLCVLHVAICADDNYAVNRILDRTVAVSDLIDALTGRSIINTAMDTEMPIIYVINLIAHLKRKCPAILADLMNVSSVLMTDAVDLFHRTLHCRPVADALIAAIPNDRMHETLSRQRGLCHSTIFHLAAEYPFAYVQLVGHGARFGISTHDMLSSPGRITGTPMHAVADGCFNNFNSVVADINLHCDLSDILNAMFVQRPHDNLYPFECLRNVTDFDYFLNLTISRAVDLMRAPNHRIAIIRHAVRIGSLSVVTGRIFAQLDATHEAAAAAEVHAYAARDDSLLYIAAQSFSAWHGPVCDIMFRVLSHVNPRHVTPKTERALLLACAQNIFRDNYANEIVDRFCAIGAMHTLCMRVSAIRRWRNVRAYVIRRWLLNWWVERATRQKYAPGGCVFVLNQEDAMSLFEE